MHVYISATKESGNIPEDAVLIVKILPHPSAVIPYSSEIHAKLDGNLYDLSDAPDGGREYLPIEDGNSIVFTYAVGRPGKDENGQDVFFGVDDAKVNVHIEVETEYK